MVDAVLSAGLTQSAAATAFGVSVRTVAKWISRFRAEGRAGLRDRSSRPRLSPRQTLPAQQALVLSLRVEQRLPAFQIARSCGLSKATVSRLLRRHDLHRHRAIHPPPPVVRYQREFPGELIHFDIKTLGKFERPGARHTGNPRDFTFQAGYEHLHVAIDDASRLAFAQLLPDASAKSALAFLDASLAFFATHAITAQAVMTDNGPCYNARVFRRAVAARGLRHIFTRPYTPRTNGKAERFIQTSLREWAYARTYQSSAQRATHLAAFLHHYNWHRPHHSLHLFPPASSLPLPRNNLLTLHTYLFLEVYAAKRAATAVKWWLPSSCSSSAGATTAANCPMS